MMSLNHQNLLVSDLCIFATTFMIPPISECSSPYLVFCPAHACTPSPRLCDVLDHQLLTVLSVAVCSGLFFLQPTHASSSLIAVEVSQVVEAVVHGCVLRSTCLPMSDQCTHIPSRIFATGGLDRLPNLMRASKK